MQKDEFNQICKSNKIEIEIEIKIKIKTETETIKLQKNGNTVEE